VEKNTGRQRLEKRKLRGGGGGKPASTPGNNKEGPERRLYLKSFITI